MTIIAGRLVAECTLRLLKPECRLSSDWSAESLDSQFRRVVALLHADTLGEGGADEAPGVVAGSLLAAPCFAYCLYLLRAVLTANQSEQDEALIVRCLDMMSAHAAGLRADSDKDEVRLLSDSAFLQVKKN